MFRPVSRAAATSAHFAPKAQQLGRRFASTGASKPSSFKGTLARWTAAGAIVYYYNTSSVFAEEPQCKLRQYAAIGVAIDETSDAVHAAPETSQENVKRHSTVDTIAEQRRAQARSNAQSSAASVSPQSHEQPATVAGNEQPAPSGPGALEEEAEQQGAFNEETGEINWDCPCLGGMAHGPCGEQFRAAFSCFVYSKEEPKGVDCIEHFKTMQNCFREHPDIYGSELDDEEVAEVQVEEERAEIARGRADGAVQAVNADAPRQAEDDRVHQANDQIKQNEPPGESDEVVGTKGVA